MRRSNGNKCHGDTAGTIDDKDDTHAVTTDGNGVSEPYQHRRGADNFTSRAGPDDHEVSRLVTRSTM